MSKWSNMVQQLSDEDSMWLVDNGRERHLAAGTTLIEEGTRIEAVYFVLRGVFKVMTRQLPDQQLARIGASEVVGEMSFIDDSPTSATVVALEDGDVLEVERQKLRERMSGDSAFEARFYKALGGIMAQRLRERIARYPRPASFAAGLVDVHGVAAYQELQGTLDRFKQLVAEADKEALKGRGRIPGELSEAARGAFLLLGRQLNEIMNCSPQTSAVIKEEIARHVKQEIYPYLLLASTAERFYSKPRGYPGDYYTIELIYRNRARGSRRVGKLIDRCFLDTESCRAVRNRRHLLSEEILGMLAAGRGEPLRITSMACGPAREILDVMHRLGQQDRLEVTLVDMDREALEFVEEHLKNRPAGLRLRFLNENLIYASLRRKELDLPAQDLIYSVGLIDYFRDRLVVRLMDYLYDLLKPGGRLILGNFHPRNPDKALLDHVVEWELYHRTEQDMNRLFESSRFGSPCTKIRFEEQQINLFAESCRP